MYDPNIGQWLEEDPVDVEGGLSNFRSYVGNDGTNSTDLSGLETNPNIEESIFIKRLMKVDPTWYDKAQEWIVVRKEYFKQPEESREAFLASKKLEVGYQAADRLRREQEKEYSISTSQPSAKMAFEGDFSAKEKAQLIAATRLASENIYRSREILRNYWKELGDVSVIPALRPDGTAILEPRYKKLASNITKYSLGISPPGAGGYIRPTANEVSLRNEFLAGLDKVWKKLGDPNYTVEFVRETSPEAAKETEGNGARWAYVNTYTRFFSGTAIHITNAFYDLDLADQAEKISHEFARAFAGYIGEDNGGGPRDVQEWDNTISFLARKWGAIMALRVEKP